ncbi:MAG: NAD(P)H-dependent oxidoreductase subunit E, partial [Candidatus Baltobacteraceae bacterium]
MDLHFTSALATPEERAAVDAVLSPDAATDRTHRHLLLEALHAVQDRIGWLSEGALNYAGERLCVPPAEIYGVATFYALFSTTPQPPLVVHLCDDIACLGAGTNELRATVATVLSSPCLGLCDRAPAALVAHAGER